ncbi:unnamed protein product [Brassica oleracea]
MQHMVDTHAIKAMDLYLGLIFFICGLWVTLDDVIGQSQDSSHQPHRQVPGAEGNFVFINDACYKKPDISKLPFPTYLAPEDEDPSELEPLVADLGEVDPFITYVNAQPAGNKKPSSPTPSEKTRISGDSAPTVYSGSIVTSSAQFVSTSLLQKRASSASIALPSPTSIALLGRLPPLLPSHARRALNPISPSSPNLLTRRFLTKNQPTLSWQRP